MIEAAMHADSRIFVAGAHGLVGSALVRRLREDGFRHILTPSSQELDLRHSQAVENWFSRARPSHVFLAAGTVGGIHANATRPADFIYDNLAIATNVIQAAHAHRVSRLLAMGSSCIYPRLAPQPVTEEALLSGPLEPTNAPYAVAKIAAVSMCESFRRQHGSDFFAVMPTNLYGPHDRFSENDSHVIPALMRRFDAARDARAAEVVVWGTGSPLREFLHVDDLADACVFLMQRYASGDLINIGSGEELTIAALAGHLRDLIHPGARLVFDPAKPDGPARKALDNRRLQALGWRPRIGFRQGLQSTWEWFCAHRASLRR